MEALGVEGTGKFLEEHIFFWIGWNGWSREIGGRGIGDEKC